MPAYTKDNDIEILGSTLFDIASLLMVSGSSTVRIRTTIDRVVSAFGYTAYMLISQRTIMMSIYNDADECVFSSLKRTPQHGINFTVVSGISRMSWLIVEEKWDLQRINADLNRIRGLKHYPRLVTLFFTGLAGAAFCRLAGGGIADLLTVLLASFVGLFVRQEAHKFNFNPYVCVYFAAFTASMIAGALVKFDPANKHEFAFATSVLFLIPGVPLINAFSDIIDGNLQNGLIRGLNGFIISFSIALGLLTSMAIYRF